ncbi:MAG TPA: DMT family transporter [Candidatus Limnocylindrales bacterium]|nr:DMT family transporter [Candidatus Limnocylindrales bacterium]
MTARSSRLDWLLFVLLGFFWGSSYLFIKIGVDAGLPPFMLITLRLLIGFLLLASVVAIAREPLPRNPRTYGHLIVMGAVNIAIPFSLITWAELTVESALASILTAPVPLFVIVIAAIFLRDERITANRIAGLVAGFVGVAVLVGFDPAAVAAGDLAGEIALLGATLSYACGAVYARRNVHGLRPMIPAVFQVGFALVMVATLTLVFERPFEVNVTPEAWFSVVWLGLFGSGLAYLVFFRILGRWGATRTSMVAYLLPVFGITLGALVLNEPVDARLLIGTGLVIGGIALVNSRYGARPLFQRGPASAAPAKPR